jgi:hypothetical protein
MSFGGRNPGVLPHEEPSRNCQVFAVFGRKWDPNPKKFVGTIFAVNFGLFMGRVRDKNVIARAYDVYAPRLIAGLIRGLHPPSCPFTIFAGAEQTKTGQNEHDRGGFVFRRVRQIRCLYAGALSPSCDMPRNGRTVGREDLVFIQLRDPYWRAQCNSIKELP